jgi:hypothetical protein
MELVAGSYARSSQNKKLVVSMNIREGELDKGIHKPYTLHGYDKYHYNNHKLVEVETPRSLYL